MGILKTVFQFKRPRLAWIAVMVFFFVMAMVFIPKDSVEKFGFMLAFGFGAGFLVHGAKAMMTEFSNLAVWMAALGLGMIAAGVLGTPNWVFAASALEEEATLIIGAGLGFFAKIEEG